MKKRPWLLAMLVPFGMALFAAGPAWEENVSEPGSGVERKGGPRLVIIDDDVGMLWKGVLKDGVYQAPWFKVTDPDGGIQLIYALREPKIKILGITCAMGCSSTDVCMKSARKILELTGRTDVPLLKGADNPDELGIPTEASDFIIRTVMGNPGKVEIIAAAPLTNIATAMMLEPRLARNWKRLHLFTGDFIGALGEPSDGAKGASFGYKDMNINVDPEACRYVLEHGGVFPVYPNEIMDDLVITRQDRMLLKKADTPLSRWVADELRIMTFFYDSSAGEKLAEDRGWPPHGAIGQAVAIDPRLAEPPLEVRIEMAYRDSGGWYFKASDDPSIPLRPVFLQVKDPETIKQGIMDRCK